MNEFRTKNKKNLVSIPEKSSQRNWSWKTVPFKKLSLHMRKLTLFSIKKFLKILPIPKILNILFFLYIPICPLPIYSQGVLTPDARRHKSNCVAHIWYNGGKRIVRYSDIVQKQKIERKIKVNKNLRDSELMKDIFLSSLQVSWIERKI